MSTTPVTNSSVNEKLQKDFLRACMTFEPDVVSFENSTRISDHSDAMLEAARNGLNLCAPFTLTGMEDYTPLGFAAESLSALALRIHEVTGRFKDSVPTPEEEQTKKHAYSALHSLVNLAIETTGRVQTSADPKGDAYQTMGMLVKPGDLELVNKCLASGMKLEVDFLRDMGVAQINRFCTKDEDFNKEFQRFQASHQSVSDIKSLINDAPGLLKMTCDELKAIHPAIKKHLDAATVDAALVIWTRGQHSSEVLEGLLGAGANPLGMRANDPTAKSALWETLKDRTNLLAAAELLNKTKDMSESHDGMSLLALLAFRQAEQEQQLVPIAASKGAKFLSKDEADKVLIESSERGQLDTVKIALAQNADINVIHTSAHGDSKNALIQAARFDRPEVVKFLLESGAKPDLQVSVRGVSIDHGGMYTVLTDFFQEVVKLDSVESLRSAAEVLGFQSLQNARATEKSPKCKDFLAAAKALGSIPPKPQPELEMSI